MIDTQIVHGAQRHFTFAMRIAKVKYTQNENFDRSVEELDAIDARDHSVGAHAASGCPPGPFAWALMLCGERGVEAAAPSEHPRRSRDRDRSRP